jgi:hypothetical protein
MELLHAVAAKLPPTNMHHAAKEGRCIEMKSFFLAAIAHETRRIRKFPVSLLPSSFPLLVATVYVQEFALAVVPLAAPCFICFRHTPASAASGP